MCCILSFLQSPYRRLYIELGFSLLLIKDIFWNRDNVLSHDQARITLSQSINKHLLTKPGPQRLYPHQRYAIWIRWPEWCGSHRRFERRAVLLRHTIAPPSPSLNMSSGRQNARAMEEMESAVLISAGATAYFQSVRWKACIHYMWTTALGSVHWRPAGAHRQARPVEQRCVFISLLYRLVNIKDEPDDLFPSLLSQLLFFLSSPVTATFASVFASILACVFGVIQWKSFFYFYFFIYD